MNFIKKSDRWSIQEENLDRGTTSCRLLLAFSPNLRSYPFSSGKAYRYILVFTTLSYGVLVIYAAIVKLHDLISSIADSKLISDDSLDKLQHRGARPIDRTLTLEELMDEMPFVGRDGDIRETITIIKDQFQLWLDISKSKQRLRNVKDVAILCCTGPSGIGKTTFGRYLRHTLAVQDGASEFEKAAQYGEKRDFLVRIAFDVDLVKIQEFQDPDRSLALRLLYAIIGSSLRDEQKYLTYYEFHDTYFNSSEPFNLRILLQQLAKQMPPGTMGILQIEFDETNSVLRDEQGIRYIVSIVQELNTSLFYSRSIFVSSLFSGTYSAELHSAVKRSASRISKISLTPLTAVEYQQSIGKLLERKFILTKMIISNINRIL